MRYALLLLAATAICAAAPVNLVDNAGFEAGMAGWSVGLGSGVAIDDTEAHSGTSSARIAAEHSTAGIDADALAVGYDIYADMSYQASAWVKTSGIEKGDFAGRLYFYGAGNEVLKMYSFGGIRSGAAAADWKHVSVDFGAGTSMEFPPGAQQFKLRFSIWQKDEDATGTIWVDDVQLIALGEAEQLSAPQWLNTSETGTAVLLKDDMPAGSGAVSVAALSDLLSDAGMAVNIVDAARLAEPGALNSRWVDLIVLPNAPSFPADARDSFVRYALNGGSFMAFGGLAFDKMLRKHEGDWVDTDRTNTDIESAQVLADFDAEAAPDMDLGHCQDDMEMGVSRIAPGADGTAGAVRLTYPDDAGWAYAAVKDAQAGNADANLLCFWARGDENTSTLVIEINEEDKSRWKRVVDISEQWQWYVLSAKEFLSYATEGRGGPGDFLDPQKATHVWFGLTKSLGGDGGHAIDIDQVQWRRPATGAGAPVAPIRPGTAIDTTIKAFGSDISEGTPTRNRVPVFTPVTHYDNAVQLRIAWPTSGQSTVTTGAVAGYLATASTRTASTVRGLRLGGPRGGRLVTLLDAIDSDGNVIGPAASMFLPSSRRMRGAAWVFCGVESLDLLAGGSDALDGAISIAARIAAGRPAIAAADMKFIPVDGKATSSVVVSVQGAHDPDLSIRVTGQAGDSPLRQQTTEVPTAGLVEVNVPDLDPTEIDYRLTVELLQNNELLDSETIAVDTRKCFLTLVDWLVEHQSEDGTYSGISFEDNRGARGILGAYEITGDEKYLQSAIRWGEEMIRLQREDGGYRMGYGIGSKGEACYVADGGEIAIAMTRLISYTEGEQKQRFIDSVQAYMGYRESFREDNGAIGVGWCLHDYGKRPIEPLDKPARIYAGERNIYTIGCSLAAVAGFAQVNDDPEFQAMALRDTEWLIEHYSSYSGAGVESAFWAHHFLADDALQEKIEADLQTGFVDRMVQPTNEGWLGGAGRSVLDLDAIVYWLERIGPDPGLRAAKGRWLYALCDSDSTSAIKHVLERGENVNSPEYRFLDFASVALADTVSPMVSMKEF